ncbi:MAG: AMP-binding protein [Emcibacter sp.]|nr:AMP-binding protein [Emcibacter sp.]
MSLNITRLTATQRDTLALRDERVRYSWNELNPVMNRAINALLALDYDDRRIAVYANNSAETVIAYIAAFHAGVSSVPASYHLTAVEIAYILENSGAKALFVSPETAEAGVEAARLAGIDTVIGWRCAPDDRIIPWEDWIAAASEEEPPTDMPSQPQLHYTSGTTGTPKGTETPPTMFPAASTIEDMIDQMRARVELIPAGLGLVVGPLYHTGPLTTVRSLLGGAGVVVMSSFDGEKVLAAIEKYQIANCVMVPTHFQRLLALPKDVQNKYDVSSMKRLAHTGASCPREVKKAMIDWFGPVLIEGYGGTESGSVVMINSEDWLKKPGSVGKAIPPFEVIVVAEDGKYLGANDIGQLYFRDATGRGIIYHNDPEKTAASHIEPGVFTLGEMGYLDDDGFVFITDRVSDMIVSGGVNIYPAESEHVLLTHPDVSDVAVIGVPNTDMGEEVKALVIPTDPENLPDIEDLNNHCRKSLAGYKCPRSYDFVEDIGRNTMGKVNKRALRQKFWSGERTIGG